MSYKNPYRYNRDVTRLCEANTGTFKCDIETLRLKSLGGDDLSLMPEAGDRKPRRSLDDMRRLSEEIKRKRAAEQQTTEDPSSKPPD